MKNTTPDQRERRQDNYYKLHREAIENLVTADSENSPRYSREELERYRSGKIKWRFPETLKVILIKWWFYGAVCFFVFMGMGMLVPNQIDMLFIAAIIMGMVTDLLINHFLRFTEKLPGGNARFMMVTRRGTPGFVMNLIYAFVILFLVVTAYNGVNSLLFAITGGDPNTRLLSVEPICFGLFATAADMLCVGIRNTFKKILRDAAAK